MMLPQQRHDLTFKRLLGSKGSRVDAEGRDMVALSPLQRLRCGTIADDKRHLCSDVFCLTGIDDGLEIAAGTRGEDAER